MLLITVSESERIGLEGYKQVDNAKSYLITLPVLDIHKKRIIIIIDVSYSMEGKLLYKSIRNAEGLVHFCKYHSMECKLFILYKEVEEIDVNDLENIKPRSGTNLKNLIQFLIDNRMNYDVSIIFTDGVPTVGPKSLQKIVDSINNVEVLDEAVLLVNPNNNREHIVNLADIMKARVINMLEESLYDNIAKILVVSSIVSSLIVRLGFGHPKWIRINAPFVVKGINGWSISDVTYFQLYHIPVPVLVSSEKEQGVNIGIPIMVKKLYYENGKRSEWKLAGLLEYT